MRNPCVAHRGWSGAAPENTLAAIKLAMSMPEVQWIEIDVQLSRDGVPVVIHDYTVDRTTNGRGAVANLTAAELGALDAGSWMSPAFRGEPVPRFEQVLELTVGRCRLNVELKTDGRYPGLEERVLGLIHDYKLEHDTVITSFHTETLRNVRKLSKVVRTGLILDAWRNSLPMELAELGADFLSIGYSRINPERLRRLAGAGIETMAWTANDVKTIRKLAAMDEKLMICTNYPDRWREAIGSL